MLVWSLLLPVRCRARPKIGSKPRAPRNIRVWAAFIWMLASLHAIPDKTLPQLWQEWPEARAFIGQRKPSTLRKLSKRWGERFMAGASLEDGPRRKKRPQLPNDDALLAATYLKTGHWTFIPATETRKARFEHRYYTSVETACRHCTELMAIRNKYGLNNRAFLRAMYKADPSLLKRTVRVRYSMPKKLKGERRERANVLYNRCVQDPSRLDRTYFIDECGIIIDNMLRKGAKVYCDAHDEGYKTVIHTEKLETKEQVKLHILAAVNAVHGPVYLEFTTGTTDIQHQYNTLPLHPQHGPYKVSACTCSGWADDCVATSITHGGGARQHVT